ncbi:N-acetyltransferase [Parvularcula flava]|uniref:N-acetyltransferase n=1 Tax=Aquisalinus luteolus TaxID=1566827 RepID=A0A8J3EQ63_9PROT|nr:GNAT family N-acetyltransferase [Aquisalinus luteolus]NHK26622.1 N-acetyltransferase [Aquisalinus luteolus]GGH92904.1 N-acetyltransferase [Aquisalinus luteolus]
MSVELKETGSGGQYYLPDAEAGDDIAEMTFSRASDKLIIVDHTYVPDRYRGQGVGKQLVDRLIADAREKGFKIVPLCPFVKAQFQKHPEWHDVLSK